MTVLATPSATAPRRPTTRSFVAPTVAIVLAVVSSFLAALAFQTSDGEAITSAELDHRRDGLAVVRTALRVERDASDELVRRLLGELGHSTVAIGERGVAAMAELDRLETRGGDVGRAARALTDAIDSAGGIERAEVPELLEIMEVAAAVRATVGDGSDEVIAAVDLVALPARLVLGGLAAHLLAAGPADADEAALLEGAVTRSVTAPLDTAQPAPGADAPLFDRLDAVLLEHEMPALHDELEQVAAGERSRPGVDPVALVQAGVAATTDLDAAWAAAEVAVDAALATDERESDLRRHRFRIAGWGLLVTGGLLVIGAFVLAAVGRRTTRSAIDLTSTTPFPGFLDPAAFRRVNAPLVADSRLNQHLFAVVRVARIEMVTDAYGAAAGERVERLVTRRLQRATAWLVGGREDTEAVVSRRRAGEYDLAIHSARSIDVDLVRRVLLLRSGTAIPLGQDHVPVSYTVGLHLELGATDVDDALDAAERGTLDRPSTRDLAPRPVAAPLDLVRT